ncbi:MAG TPA: NAD(P)/FAD-dependent oxidoreductase [Jatrophihabitantaceae bacterium]|jgi:thioredoxin reductase
MTNEFDVVIVGGGLSGLGAALALVRARRSVLVVDSGRPRNAPSGHSHGFLTRDGMPPLDLLRIGRLEVQGYGGQIVDGQVGSLTRHNDGFRVHLDDGTLRLARRVLVTTGLADELPDVPGLAQRWGRDVVHCPYCFGWEMRDRALGVLASSPHSVAQTLLWRQWSGNITLLRHTAELSDEQRGQLAAWNIPVVDGEVTGLEIDNDRLRGVRLRSGQLVELDVLVVGPRMRAHHSVLGNLDVTLVEHPKGIGQQVQADPGGKAAPGVWVAGNVADVTLGVLQAAASGVTAAVSLNADLIAEDTSRAMALTPG